MANGLPGPSEPTDVVVVDHTNWAAAAAGHFAYGAYSFLGDFARYLRDELRVPSSGTILSYLYSVQAFCTNLGYTRPILTPALQRALERDEAAAPARHAKDPAPPDLASAIILDPAIPPGLRAAVILLWFGTLRGGEILSKRVTTYDPLCFRRRDLTFAEDGSFARLHLRRGKALVRNQETARTIVRPAADQPWAFDPVAALLEYKRITAAFDDDAPLLRHLDGKLVTYQQLLQLIKATAERQGLDPSKYCVHSIRAAGATLMRAGGVGGADARLQGGWRSETGDDPYKRVNVLQAGRAQHPLALPAPGSDAPSSHRVRVVTASSPLLDTSAALAALARGDWAPRR